MIISHVLQNAHLISSNADHCLLRLAPRIAASSNKLRFIGALGFDSGFHTRSSRVYGRSFSVAAVRASMETTTAPTEVAKSDPIVQYIVLRKDLMEALKWPLGSVISQGCHAAVAAIILHKDDPSTAEYTGIDNLDNMHTVTLEVKGETQLRNLAQKLEAGGVAHKLWIEQPENFPTCLATRPYRKSEVASFFKSLKLCR